MARSQIARRTVAYAVAWLTGLLVLAGVAAATADEGRLEVAIAKNRHGPAGRITLPLASWGESPKMTPRPGATSIP